MKHALFPAAVALALCLSPVGAADDGVPDTRTVDRWTSLDAVVIGQLVAVQQGPIAKSFPPIYNHTLTIRVDRVLRGDAEPGGEIEVRHAARQHDKPTFPEGKRVVVGLKDVRGSRIVQQLVEADDDTIAAIETACSLPVGWIVVDGKPRSPWASLGKNAWLADAPAPADMPTCAVTGRPALMVGAGVEFAVEPVPPAEDIKWTNPDGDGAYRVTLTNPTDKPIVVPALRRTEENVLWDESLVIVCQGRSYTVPGASGVKVATEPVTLKPGESVSHVVNALALNGPDWPRGGYRIEFTFALGERSVTCSFYYMSRHHDALRDKAQAAVQRGG